MELIQLAEENFNERFNGMYTPDNWDDDESLGVDFEELKDICQSSWDEDKILRSAFKDVDGLVLFMTQNLNWEHPSTLIEELIRDIDEEEDLDATEIDLEIARAKEVLTKAGYFTKNLWHIDDVKDRYATQNGEELDDNTALEVLSKTLTIGSTIESIYDAMEIVVLDEFNLKNKENE